MLCCAWIFLIKKIIVLNKIPIICPEDAAVDEAVEGVASEAVAAALVQEACLLWVSHLQTYKLCLGKETRCIQCGASINIIVCNLIFI